MRRRIRSDLSLFEKFRLRKHAERDAEIGEHQGAHRVAQLVGERPRFAPESNPIHQDAVNTLAAREPLDAKEREFAAEERHACGLIRLPVLLALLGFAFVLECVSSLLAAAGLGAPPHLRLILGCALAVTMIGTTHASVGCASPVPSRLRRIRLLVWSFHMALVIAVGVVRLHESLASGEDSLLFGISVALLTMASVAVPPFLAEWALRKLRSQHPTTLNLVRLRRELQNLRQRHERARGVRDWYFLAAESWDGRNHLAAAVYEAAFRSRQREVATVPLEERMSPPRDLDGHPLRSMVTRHGEE